MAAIGLNESVLKQCHPLLYDKKLDRGAHRRQGGGHVPAIYFWFCCLPDSDSLLAYSSCLAAFAYIYFLSGPTKSNFSCICFKWIHQLCWTQSELLPWAFCCRSDTCPVSFSSDTVKKQPKYLRLSTSECSWVWKQEDVCKLSSSSSNPGACKHWHAFQGHFQATLDRSSI